MEIEKCLNIRSILEWNPTARIDSIDERYGLGEWLIEVINSG